MIRDNPWFNNDLKIMKRELEAKSKQFENKGNDPFFRGTFFKLLKKYRKKNT